MICNSNLPLLSPPQTLSAENLCGGRFHHFILETFFPMLVRYLDLMESSIDQSLKKAFDKEKWIPPGQATAGAPIASTTAVPATKATAAADPSMQAICTCASTDELYWKLQALQTFFKQLNWPDKVYSSHLTTRLSKMAAEKIIDAVKRTMTAFLSFKRGKSLTAGVAARFSSPTDYLVPVSGRSDLLNQCRRSSVFPCLSCFVSSFHFLSSPLSISLPLPDEKFSPLLKALGPLKAPKQFKLKPNSSPPTVSLQTATNLHPNERGARCSTTGGQNLCDRSAGRSKCCILWNQTSFSKFSETAHHSDIYRSETWTMSSSVSGA